MTLIAGRAGLCRSRADSVRTNVVSCASVAIATRRAVGLGRVRTSARARIARTSVMTLVARRACNRIGPGTHSRLTSVCLSARVAVITGGAVLLRWV